MARFLLPLVFAILLTVSAHADGGPRDIWKPGGEPAASQPEFALQPNQAVGERNAARLIRFSKPTPAEAAEVAQFARDKAQAALDQCKLRLATFDTRHFSVYTNWTRDEQRWLAATLEQMYSGLAKQFGIDADDSVWPGKLPVFAFAQRAEFQSFATRVDHLGGEVAKSAGYARYTSTGRVHLVVWRIGKPDLVAGLIVHEGTHAFLARYRTNMDVPSWLNEGLAQNMSHMGKPNELQWKWDHTRSTDIARSTRDLTSLFGESTPFDLYPVAMTLTEMMLKLDRQAYVNMIHDIKDGVSSDEALKKHFNMTRDQLLARWRAWASKGFPAKISGK